MKLLQETLRGAVAVSAIILNQYTDAQGRLVRAAGLRDVAVLLKVAMEGLTLVHASATTPAAGSDLEETLRTAPADVRTAVLQGMRAVLWWREQQARRP